MMRHWKPEDRPIIEAYCRIRDAAKTRTYTVVVDGIPRSWDGVDYANDLHQKGYRVGQYKNKKYYAKNDDGWLISPLPKEIAHYLQFLGKPDSEKAVELRFIARNATSGR